MNRETIEDLLAIRDDGIVCHHESQTLELKENFNFAGLTEYF